MGSTVTRRYAAPEYTDEYNRYLDEAVAEQLLTNELTRLIQMTEEIRGMLVPGMPGVPADMDHRLTRLRNRLRGMFTEVDYVVLIPRPRREGWGNNPPEAGYGGRRDIQDMDDEDDYSSESTSGSD